MADASRERLRAEHAAALDMLAGPLEDAATTSLRAVLRAAFASANRGLVAAAADEPIDLNALSSITARWEQEVTEDLIPLLRSIFLVAGESEWGRLADAFAARRDNPLLPDVRTVLGDLATDYLAVARNRLVGVGDTAWDLARGELEQGMRAGEPIDDLTVRVEHVLDVAEGRARTIARTETLGAVNAGQTVAVRQLGADAPRFKEWLATADSRTRDTHWVADGQRVRLDERFVVGGASLDYPGDPSGPAREVVNCRCTVLFVDDAPLPAVTDVRIESGT